MSLLPHLICAYVLVGVVLAGVGVVSTHDEQEVVTRRLLRQGASTTHLAIASVLAFVAMALVWLPILVVWAVRRASLR